MRRFFLTIDWCNKGKRGIFCDKKGSPFSAKDEHSKDEMDEILGAFWMILNPESKPYTEQEISEFNRFIPLAEYTNQYGVAIKETQ